RKEFLPRQAALEGIPEQLRGFQRALFDRALELRRSRTRAIDQAEELDAFFSQEGGGFALCHWCGDGACEEALSAQHKTTIRNLPLAGTVEDGLCIRCRRASRRRVVVALAY
ncbi:MAG: proline--tRNA ligase, partial [Thermoanaerobaculia bacterium]